MHSGVSRHRSDAAAVAHCRLTEPGKNLQRTRICNSSQWRSSALLFPCQRNSNGIESTAMSENDATQTILVTGASGLIGRRLVAELEAKGQRVIRAIRREVRDRKRETQWDPERGQIDRDMLASVDAVVHLAGANVAGKRWTPAYKQLLLDSRVEGTALLSETIASLESKPKVFACASAIGYYGDRGNELLDESSVGGIEFLPELCLQWERACQPARDAGVRVANMRIGVVLSPEGGALAQMLTPFKLGGGGVMGNGRQFFSWISLDDVVRAIEHVLEHEQLAGPVNLVAPTPVTNREFTKTLGKVLGRPTIVPMPAFAARLAFGEMADSLLLASTRVAPTALVESGFDFQHAELEPALRHLLGK